MPSADSPPASKIHVSPLTLASTTNSSRLPAHIRSPINAHLTRTRTIHEIQNTMLEALQKAGWIEKVQGIARELLIAGECTTFPELMERITRMATEGPSKSGREGSERNGVNRYGEEGIEDVDLRIPKHVVEQGIRLVKDALKDIVVVDNEDDEADEHDHEEEGRVQRRRTQERQRQW